MLIWAEGFLPDPSQDPLPSQHTHKEAYHGLPQQEEEHCPGKEARGRGANLGPNPPPTATVLLGGGHLSVARAQEERQSGQK